MQSINIYTLSMYKSILPYSYAFNLLPSLCGKQFSNPKVFPHERQKLGFRKYQKAWDKSKKHFCPSLFFSSISQT